MIDEPNSCPHCRCEIGPDDDYCADCAPTCDGCGRRLADGDGLDLCAACQDDEPICSACNGSGEGQHDGTRCYKCRGGGTERQPVEPDPDEWHDRQVCGED